MIFKLISLPFKIVAGIISLIFRGTGAVTSLGVGSVRMVLSRIIGVLFGVLIGFFLGKKHLRLKLFTGKK